MFTEIVWVAAAALLVVLIVAVSAQWFRHPTVARGHARNPQMAHFYGAAPMALITVGSGTMLVGKDLIGQSLAVDINWVLWSAGTIGGLYTAVSIPYLMFTQLNVGPDAAFGGWLMPVVPPMVSAASGAMLIPHMAPGTGRTTMFYGCLAMFGLSLIAALDHHHDDLEPAGAVRHVGDRARPHAVDRARPAGPVGDGRPGCWPPRRTWPSPRTWPPGWASSRCCSGCRSGVSACCGSCWPRP